MQCVFCKKEQNTNEKVSRKDTCYNCGRDLRCCKNCKYYDRNSYNECMEISAERVIDKERANFCDYFIPIGSSLVTLDKASEARKALEELFKK